MNNMLDRELGRLVRMKREAMSLSQMEFARLMDWPQAKVSRVEQGKRSVTLSEMAKFAQVARCSVQELLGGLESSLNANGEAQEMSAPGVRFTPGFTAAYENEDVLLAQLERFGVKFLGESSRPMLVELSFEEALLAALRLFHDPRVFEALPALLLRNARGVDWTKLVAGAYALRLQNRLGMVMAGALSLKEMVKNVDAAVWERLQGAHDALAEAKLDREEVVGQRPKTESAVAFLRQRTPGWMAFWHGLGSADSDSLRRYLPR